MGVEGIRHPRGCQPQLCRYAGRREREREGEEDATGQAESLQFPDATCSLASRPWHKLCSTLWEKTHEEAV